jgi:hypothetical protein
MVSIIRNVGAVALVILIGLIVGLLGLVVPDLYAVGLLILFLGGVGATVLAGEFLLWYFRPRRPHALSVSSTAQEPSDNSAHAGHCTCAISERRLLRLGAALAAPAGWPAGGWRARCGTGPLLVRLVRTAGTRQLPDPGQGRHLGEGLPRCERRTTLQRGLAFTTGKLFANRSDACGVRAGRGRVLASLVQIGNPAHWSPWPPSNPEEIY